MKLYTDPTCYRSHRVRMVLAEKDVPIEQIDVHRNKPLPESVLEINPTGEIPMLADHNLRLFNTSVLIEYLDERFPHPPMLPVYPNIRAQCRLWIYELDNNLYKLINRLRSSKSSNETRKKMRGQMADFLTAIAGMFSGYHHVQGSITGDSAHDVFSLADCCLVPILWQLPVLGVELPITRTTKPLFDYMQHQFERKSFHVSLSEAELKMRG